MTHPELSGSASTHETARFSRRQMLLGVGGAAVAGLATGAGGAVGLGTIDRSSQNGAGSGRLSTAAVPTSIAAETGAPVSAAGLHQAGVERPVTPQRASLIAVAAADPASILAALAPIGDLVLRMTGDGPDASTDPLIEELFPDGAGDLSITVGVGHRVLAASAAGNQLNDALDLPLFAGDTNLAPGALGGDLLIAVYGSNAAVLDPALQAIAALVPGIEVQWSEHGFRGPGEDTIARNPFGYFDGVIVPRGESEMNDNVWINSGPLAGGTICVVRRFELDTRSFGALEPAAQDRVIGRERTSGDPLSGGTLRDQVDLLAKTETGDYVIPLDSHVRAAHPSFTGSDLMLRRSYGYSTRDESGLPQSGLVFICYQREATTFTRTQLRLDESDALMRFSRPTATAAFAILPGFSNRAPLGATLSGAPPRR